MCGVMVAVEQALAEGLVDIPSIIRRIRSQLPAVINSPNDMKLVLKTMTALLDTYIH